MNYDMSSYFEDPEFKEALARYEGMVENHTPAYFEADELTDIAEYYASKGRHKDADKAINLAIQLHPDNIDALIFRARSLMLLGKKEEAQMVMQLINNPADREFRFLQADLLIEEEHMEEADKILQQLAMDEEYELDTLLDNTLFVNLAPNNQRGTATSTYLTSWDVGIGAGMLLGGYIAEIATFKMAYLFGAALTVISLFYFRSKVAPHFHQHKLR